MQMEASIVDIGLRSRRQLGLCSQVRLYLYACVGQVPEAAALIGILQAGRWYRKVVQAGGAGRWCRHVVQAGGAGR